MRTAIMHMYLCACSVIHHVLGCIRTLAVCLCSLVVTVESLSDFGSVTDSMGVSYRVWVSHQDQAIGAML